jgi:putative nucleotidyltransferase with HDIG domain
MTANEIVAKLKPLPVSRAGLRLIKLLDQPDRDNERIIQILKCDAMLTAKVLRSCNSAGCALKGRVASVDQAVLLLGYNQILRIVLSVALAEAMRVPLKAYAFDGNDLWLHSFAAAAAAETLALDGLVSDIDPSSAYTAGLLHDIGKVALHQFLKPDLVLSLRQQIAEQGLSRPDAEKVVIGADHAEVGAGLLAQWELPAEIIEAVANHHHPLVEPRPRLSALTFMANLISHLAGSAPGWESYAVHLDGAAAAALGITRERVDYLVMAVRESIERAEAFIVVE